MRYKRSQRFAASGTFTVPAGVFFATSKGMGGTGDCVSEYSGQLTVNPGSASTVAFNGGTVTHPSQQGFGARNSQHTILGADGTGVPTQRGFSGGIQDIYNTYPPSEGGGTVIPGSSIAVTVGAGASAGSGRLAGHAGYVLIEWEV